MAEVRCPTCGEDEELRGVRVGDVVVISCESCGARFERETVPRCAACGSLELVRVPTNLLEDSGRGDMTTPTGIVDRWLCWSCGARDATAPDATRAGSGWRRERAELGLRRHLRTRDD